MSYRSSVRLGSFHARDNISNFITWCRGLGIDDVLMFETDDLVLRKNERSVILCLLEVNLCTYLFPGIMQYFAQQNHRSKLFKNSSNHNFFHFSSEKKKQQQSN